nr:uncharacterized protein LOC116776466 [Danaus plexippus plexippus]
MVIRKSRTVKYKDCKKEEVSAKEEKFTSVAQTQPHLTDDVKQEDTESTLAYRLMCNLATELPKPRKQDATMQTDPILSEDEQNSMEINFDIDYDMPKDFSKQNDDFIPQTNEEYNKEAEKYALQIKNHSQYDQKVESYTKLPEVYNGFREKAYSDVIYQNTYTDSVEILRNQQHNLQMLQEQHRINENQNFFNEDHIKQEIDFTNDEEKFLYERNKEQIDHSMYEHREQQSIIDHVTTVKQEPEVTGGTDILNISNVTLLPAQRGRCGRRGAESRVLT